MANEFGAALLDLREIHQLSQSRLARRIGISPQYLCDLECGRRRPSIRVVESIVTKFGPMVQNGAYRHRWHCLGARANGWRI